MKKILKYISFLALLGMVVAGCTREIGSDPKPDNGSVMVNFEVELPTAKQVLTRSGQVVGEARVNNVYILIFKKDGTFVDHKIVTNLPDADQSGSAKETKKFKVSLPMSASTAEADKLELVLLANVVDGELGGFKTQLETQITARTAKTDFLKNLNHYAAGNVEMPVPMASVDKGAITIDSSTDFTGTADMGNNKPGAFKLIRMVARIDVGFTGDLPGHKVTEVHMYNHNIRGKVYTGKEATPAGGISPAGTPGMVSDAGFPVMNTATDNTVFKELLYAFEAKVHDNNTPVAHNVRPSIVVRLSDASDKDLGYFRIDFYRNSDSKWLDILRNHRYIFSIKKISGVGYSDAGTAYRSTVSNVDVNVVEWDDENVGDVVVSGRYTMVVGPTEFELHRDASNFSDNTITVATNLPLAGNNKQWTAEVVYVDGSGWLHLENASGGDTSDEITITKSHLRFKTDENSTTAPRVAWIHVKGGDGVAKVKVTQGITGAIKLDVTHQGLVVKELKFSGSDLTPKTIDVNWYPLNADLSIENTNINGKTPFAGTGVPMTGTLVNGNGGTGKVSYTIKPTAFTPEELTSDPFIEKTSKIEFWTSNGTDLLANSIFISHKNYAITHNALESYTLDNTKTYTFRVKSNTTWKVTSVSGRYEVLDPTTNETYLKGISGGNNTTTGDPITIKLIDDDDLATHSGKSFTITLTDTSGEIALPVNIVIKVAGNCGVNGITVPQKIGKGTYATHFYGSGDSKRCWMVENSKEAIALNSANLYSTTYGSDNVYTENPSAKGYYYSLTQGQTINNACPAGWEVPSDADFEALITDLISNTNVDATKYWTSTDYNAGYRWAGPSMPNWSTYYTFFISTSNKKMRANEGSNITSIALSYTDYTWSNEFMMSVRCVKKK